MRSCRLERRPPAGPVSDQQRGNHGERHSVLREQWDERGTGRFQETLPDGQRPRNQGGKRARRANHCPIDWFETGLTDLLIRNEDGFLQLYRNSFFENPPEIEVSDVVARP